MGWVNFGGRDTYLPAFVNERFDGPPYWACTYTAGLMGANIAALGTLPATQAEIAALAKASGDKTLRAGSSSTELATALKARYGLRLRRSEHLGADEIARRLGTGWALIAGCTYGSLPTHYRRWSPNFTLGHRVLLAGWDKGWTRIFDPMAVMPKTYVGEAIKWSDFAPAFWSADQAWIIEGELMRQTVTVLAEFDPVRTFVIPAGSTIQAYTLTGPGHRATFAKGSTAHFGRIVRVDQAPDPKLVPHGGPFVWVSDGLFAGELILASSVTNPDGSPITVDQVVTPEVILEARRLEYDRVTTAARAAVVYPERP